MENSTLTRKEDVWQIGERYLRHSLDANGDLSTLEFDINIIGGDLKEWHVVRLVPRPLFLKMARMWFEPMNSAAIDGPDNEYIGAFNTAEPDECFAVLRSSQDAIHRMAHIMTVHHELNAVVELHTLPDHSAGLITGFTLSAIDLRPGA